LAGNLIMPTVLIVDQDMENLLSLAEVCRNNGYVAETAQDLQQARAILLRRMPEVALFNERVGEDYALDLLEQIDLAEVVEIYLMSASRSVKSASRAMRLGISDYLYIPVDTDHLVVNLRQLDD
jgi:DNA-binding NtrC family response regulator